MEIKEIIKQYISSGHTEEAVDQLTIYGQTQSAKNILISNIVSEYHRVKDLYIAGVISEGEYSKNINGINYRILSLIEEKPISAGFEERPNSTNFFLTIKVKLALTLILISIFGIGGWLLFKNKTLLNERADNLALPVVQILEPRVQQSLKEGFRPIKGTIVGEIPAGFKLRIFAKKGSSYFPMLGQVVPESGEWNFEKFYTGIPGDTYIVVGLVEDNFSNTLEEKMANGNFEAIPLEQTSKIINIKETKIKVIANH